MTTRQTKHKTDATILRTILRRAWLEFKSMKDPKSIDSPISMITREDSIDFNYLDIGVKISDQVCIKLLKEQIESSVKDDRTCIIYKCPKDHAISIFSAFDKKFTSCIEELGVILPLRQTDIKLYLFKDNKE